MSRPTQTHIIEKRELTIVGGGSSKFSLVTLFQGQSLKPQKERSISVGYVKFSGRWSKTVWDTSDPQSPAVMNSFIINLDIVIRYFIQSDAGRIPWDNAKYKVNIMSYENLVEGELP